MPFVYEYPRPAVCVDCVVFGLEKPVRRRCITVNVLLIERGRPPFAGNWALPGGFVDIEEPLEEAAFRELHEETGLRPAYLELAGVYGTPGRDPRGRTISVVYRTTVWKEEHTTRGGDDASAAKWFSLESLPHLAFDHQQIVSEVWKDYQRRVATQPFGKELLPEVFEWHSLGSLYEAILGKSLSSRRLKSFLIKLGLLEPAGQLQPQHPSGRKPEKGSIFRFNASVYERLTQIGFSPFIRCEKVG